MCLLIILCALRHPRISIPLSFSHVSESIKAAVRWTRYRPAHLIRVSTFDKTSLRKAMKNEREMKWKNGIVSLYDVFEWMQSEEKRECLSWTAAEQHIFGWWTTNTFFFASGTSRRLRSNFVHFQFYFLSSARRSEIAFLCKKTASFLLYRWGRRTSRK